MKFKVNPGRRIYIATSFLPRGQKKNLRQLLALHKSSWMKECHRHAAFPIENASQQRNLSFTPRAHHIPAAMVCSGVEQSSWSIFLLNWPQLVAGNSNMVCRRTGAVKQYAIFLTQHADVMDENRSNGSWTTWYSVLENDTNLVSCMQTLSFLQLCDRAWHRCLRPHSPWIWGSHMIRVHLWHCDVQFTLWYADWS